MNIVQFIGAVLIAISIAPITRAGELLPIEGTSPAPQATPATDSKEEDASITIEFAAPPQEGTISLGIYNSAGELVRVLKEAAEPGDFQIGLNGLIARWDARNDAGETVPPGSYAARGVTVGDLVIEGEAYLGNDWVGPDGTPRLRQIAALAAHPDGPLVLLAENAAGQFEILQATVAGEINWHRPLPAGGYIDQVAVGREAAFAATKEKVLRLDFTAGEPVVWDIAGTQKMDASQDRVAFASAKRIQLHAVATGDVIAEIPLARPVEAVAVDSQRLVIVQDGKLLQWIEEKWQPLELPGLNRAVTVRFSPAGTLWVIDATEARRDVKEYSLEGSFLRHLGIAADAPAPRQLASAKGGSQLYLFETGDAENRVRGLELVGSREEEGPGAAQVSTWEVTLSQSILRVGTADEAKPLLGNFEAKSPLIVALRENPLQPDHSDPTAHLQVMGRSDETVLTLADGLPLRVIATTPGLKWAQIGQRAGAKGVTVLQSDGVAIEEFTIHRVANLMHFDAGEYAWPKQKPATSAEEDVPAPTSEEVPPEE